MAFMYLHLTADDGGVRAEVKNEGELRFRTLGTVNSRFSQGPFAVFQISSFSGLNCIESDDLYEELLRRRGKQYLMNRLEIHLTNEELIRMVTERMGG